MDGMNRNEFQLLDVETAPLLVKRRGMKRRSESITKKRSLTNCPTKLMAVPEDHNESVPTRRPTTLDIEIGQESATEDRNFSQIRDTKPKDLKFSQDIDATKDYKNGLS